MQVRKEKPKEAGGAPRKGEQPESLATFAAASRTDAKKKPDDVGLTATPETAPIPTDSSDKDEAATKVLRAGVTGDRQGVDEAVDKLPDRTRTTPTR
jgi:hypothetical protein